MTATLKKRDYITISICIGLLFFNFALGSPKPHELILCAIFTAIGGFLPVTDYSLLKQKRDYRQPIYLEMISESSGRNLSAMPYERNPSEQRNLFHSIYMLIPVMAIYFITASYGETAINTLTGFYIKPWFWILGMAIALGYTLTLTIEIFTGRGIFVLPKYIFDEDERKLKINGNIFKNRKIRNIITIICLIVSITILSRTYISTNMHLDIFEKLKIFIEETWSLLSTGHK